MPITTPDEQDLVRQSQAYVRSELPELDPSAQKANFITGIVIALAKTLNHWYLALADFANRQVHPQTATGTVLFRGWWSALTGLQRTPISAATGRVIATGTAGLIIPLGSGFTIGSASYESTSSATVTSQSLRASSLQMIGSVAVFETVSPHGLATGQTFVISGSLDAAYNGTFEIYAASENEFTYTPLTAPSIAAGVDVLATSDYASIPIKALQAGKAGNVDGGEMSFDDIIDDVDSIALVPFDGIVSGADLEEPEPFRERLLDALASTLGVFTAEEIRDQVKNIPGVTRVWIRKAQKDPETGWPIEGQTKILFMRDNDANPIPSAQEAQSVKDFLIANILPAHTAEEDLIVIAPTPVKTNFTFASISPDSASMRLAISAQLTQYFDENIGIGADLPKRPHSDLLLMQLKCWINDTIDLETGQRLDSFDLTDPSSDVTVDPDSIPVLGSVVFS